MRADFLITTFIIVALPGAGAIYTLTAGLSRGARASLVAAFRCTLGIIPHLLATLLGLSVLLHASAIAFEIFRYLGVAFLLFIAWNAWREKGSLRIEPDQSDRSDWQTISQAVLINLLNPKLSMFFLAFLPQFIAADAAHPVIDMLAMSAVFMVMTFLVFALYGFLAARIRRHILTTPAVIIWMRRCFAVAFAGLGAKLFLAVR